MQTAFYPVKTSRALFKSTEVQSVQACRSKRATTYTSVFYSVQDTCDLPMMRAIAGSETVMIGAVYYDSQNKRQLVLADGKFKPLSDWVS